jgi:hypothetical protein
MSTAFISGVVALIIANKRTGEGTTRYTKQEILSDMASCSIPIEQLGYNDPGNFSFTIKSTV